MGVSPLEFRYRTDMNDIFDEENKLRYWLMVEVALAKAHAAVGNIPKEAPHEIERASKRVKIERVRGIEKKIHHDMMAAAIALGEQCGKEYGAYIHVGATSYDIEDTATALIFKDALSLLRKHTVALLATIKSLAKRHRDTVCIGRTHGQQAVPTTYGMRFALYYMELMRHLERLGEAEKRICVGKMSGAVGTMATFGGKGFEIQRLVMKELGLAPAQITNQIVQRDRHAEILFIISMIGATLEKMAKEIRNEQRTEIAELAEPFGREQVGSSAMPHKRNPHKSERVCSLARILRANVITALENIPLEHERDLTNSANERLIFGESFVLCDYMLCQMNDILKGLSFFPENIKKNLEITNGLIMAERVMTKLCEKGMGRQTAYSLVRGACVEVIEKKGNLLSVLSGKKEIRKFLTTKELTALFDPTTYIGEAKRIVDNALSG
jgi:adenylosuccinate lyase